MKNFNNLEWASINEERQELIEIFNEFEDAVKNNKTNFDYAHILSRLIDFATLHFSNTEIYLRSNYNPKKNIIMPIYKSFIFQLLKIKVELSLGKKIDVDKVYKYLNNWLQFHLIYDDSLMFENGVSANAV